MAKAKKPKYLDDAFEEVCADLLTTFLSKHKDYGKGNILSIKELGMSFRISEKGERLKNLLMTPGDPENEPIDDTWTDIAVYAVIGLLYRKGYFEALDVNPNRK